MGKPNFDNMNGRMNNRESEPRRSQRLGALLREAQAPEVLPWQRVEAIVAAAPPVRASFFSFSYGQPMRLAAGFAAALVLMVGALAVIPAQAQHVGTIISTQLPSAWQPNSGEMGEFRAAAQQQFAGLHLPDSQLYILNVAQSGRPELAVVMQNVAAPDARAFYSQMAKQYPALVAESFTPRVEDVEADSPGSLLSVALAGALQPGRLAGLSESDARIAVLKSLSQMDLTPTEVKTHVAADGTLTIDISAQMPIAVEGHTQEDLAGHGLSRETLGPDAFEELLKAVK